MEKLRLAVRDAGLEDYFTLTGPLDNPYGVMRRADAVCVLSDHESWSMVITEAKALGVPVIATRTSGALEQIEDGKNGVLCGFSDEEITESLRAFLTGGAAETMRRTRNVQPPKHPGTHWKRYWKTTRKRLSMYSTI